MARVKSGVSAKANWVGLRGCVDGRGTSNCKTGSPSKSASFQSAAIGTLHRWPNASIISPAQTLEAARRIRTAARQLASAFGREIAGMIVELPTALDCVRIQLSFDFDLGLGACFF